MAAGGHRHGIVCLLICILIFWRVYVGDLCFAVTWLFKCQLLPGLALNAVSSSSCLVSLLDDLRSFSLLFVFLIYESCLLMFQDGYVYNRGL